MRNRRNTRKRNVVISTITNRNFIIIVSVLLVLILISFGIIKIRNYLDERTMARQAEELAKQTGEYLQQLKIIYQVKQKMKMSKRLMFKVQTFLQLEIFCARWI